MGAQLAGVAKIGGECLSATMVAGERQVDTARARRHRSEDSSAQGARAEPCGGGLVAAAGGIAMLIGCPAYGAELDLAVVLEGEDARRFHGILCELPTPMVRPVVRYLGLFRLEKRRLRWSRMVGLISEISPMIKAARVKHGHASYVAPPEAWAQAMMSLVETPSASLKRPLKNNRYLFAMLAGQCEKAAAAAEEKQIQAARSRGGDRGMALRHISEIKETRSSVRSEAGESK